MTLIKVAASALNVSTAQYNQQCAQPNHNAHHTKQSDNNTQHTNTLPHTTHHE